MKDKIRIVWVDDEHENIDQSGFIEDCNEANIELKKFRSKNEALSEIRKFHGIYDLFLLDGRIVENEADSSEMAEAKYSRQLREEIKNILPTHKPILVRTGKIFEEEFDWYYEIFGNENIFKKSEESQIIIDAIFKNVKNSPRVDFEKKNFLLIEVLEKYFDNETIKIFVDLAVTTDIDNHEYRYNTLRKLFEYYIRELNKLKYLPDDLGKENINIQGSSLFLSGGYTRSNEYNKGFLLQKENSFNDVSQTLIRYLSTLLNEKSHTNSSYYSHAKEIQTKSLFQSCFNGLIELYVYTFEFYIKKTPENSWKMLDNLEYKRIKNN